MWHKRISNTFNFYSCYYYSNFWTLISFFYFQSLYDLRFFSNVYNSNVIKSKYLITSKFFSKIKKFKKILRNNQFKYLDTTNAQLLPISYFKIRNQKLNFFLNNRVSIADTNIFSNFHAHFNYLILFFNNNFFFLKGGLISPFFFHFEKKKKWLKTVSKGISKNLQNNNVQKNFKKLFFNHYHCLNTNKIAFSDFQHLIKFSNFKLVADVTNFSNFFKPYSILAPNCQTFNVLNPYLTNIHMIFKQYQKLIPQSLKSQKTVNLTQNFPNLCFFFFTNFTIENLIDDVFFNVNKKNTAYELFIIKYNGIFSRITFNHVYRIFKKFYKNKKITIKNYRFINFFLKKNTNLNNFLINKKIAINLKLYKLFCINTITYEKTILNNFKNLNFFGENFKEKFKFFFATDGNYLNRCTHKLIFFNKFFFFKLRIKIKTKFFNLIKKIKILEQIFFFTLKLSNLINLFNFNFNNYKTYSFSQLNSSFSFTNPPCCNIFKYFRLAFVISKNNSNLVLSDYGFLYLSKNYFFKEITSHSSHIVKKKYFSFTMKNEMQKFMLKRYIKSQTISYLLNSDKLKNLNIFNENTQNILSNFSANSVNSNTTLINFFSVTDDSTNLKSSLWEDDMWDAKNFENNYFSYFIRKIKFKPGYMTFWREARSILKEILNLQFKYQRKLTRYLNKFNKILKFTLFLNIEMSLKNILIRSRFFFDWSLCNFFFKNNLIFVNGCGCNNENFQLYAGDFIQMPVNVKYYVLHKWLTNSINKKKLKLKIKTKKKLAIIITEEDKTKSHTYPKWILSNKNITNDVAKFLEIDFFSLSIFIIYEPFSWQDLDVYSTNWTRFSVINMYNWKYIN